MTGGNHPIKGKKGPQRASVADVEAFEDDEDLEHCPECNSTDISHPDIPGTRGRACISVCCDCGWREGQ